MPHRIGAPLSRMPRTVLVGVVLRTGEKESMQPSEPKFVSVCESVGVFGLGDCKLEASTVLPLMNCVCCTTGVAIVKKSCHRSKPVNGP